MKIQKLAVLIASGVLVLCVCGVGMTYALLKHVTDEKVNEFAPGTVSQDIVENSDPTPDSSNTIPYDEDGAVKQVEIKNTGDVDTYVRVMLIPGWKANGTAAAAGELAFGTAPYQTDGQKLQMGDVTLLLADDWADRWLYDEATGYFYCKTRVSPGTTTGLLLERVTIAEGKATEAAWDNLEVQVISESIPAEGGALAEAWTDVRLENGALVLR